MPHSQYQFYNDEINKNLSPQPTSIDLLKSIITLVRLFLLLVRFPQLFTNYCGVTFNHAKIQPSVPRIANPPRFGPFIVSEMEDIEDIQETVVRYIVQSIFAEGVWGASGLWCSVGPLNNPHSVVTFGKEFSSDESKNKVVVSARKIEEQIKEAARTAQEMIDLEIGTHIAYSFGEIGHRYIPLRESLGFDLLSDEEFTFINQRFIRHRNWKNEGGKWLRTIILKQAKLKMVLQKHPHSVSEKRPGDSYHRLETTYIRVVLLETFDENILADESLLPSPIPTQSTNTPHQFTVTDSFDQTKTPNNSVYGVAPMKRRREHAPANRRMCRRARDHLTPQLQEIFNMWTGDKKLLDIQLDIARTNEKKQNEEERSSTSSSPPSKKRKTEKVDQRIDESNILELAAALTGDKKVDDNNHKTAYRYAAKILGRDDDASSTDDRLIATTVLLVQQLRQHQTEKGKIAAREMLDSLLVYTGAKKTGKLLDFPTTIFQYLRSNWGRRQYMDVRKSQLNISASSPHLLPPYTTTMGLLNNRLPKPLHDGLYVGPVPVTADNCHLDHDVVCKNLKHGVYGLIESPVPEDPQLPYAPFVFWRLASVLETAFDQEIWEAVTNFFNSNSITDWQKKYQLTVIVAYGGDGSGTESVSTKQPDHLTAWGMTIMSVIATPYDNNHCLNVCSESNHPEFGTCGECGQLCVYTHPHPHSPSSFRITALGFVNENKEDQRNAFTGPVRSDYMNAFSKGFKYKHISIAVEGIESKADAKWLHEQHGFHSSSLYICPLCSCSKLEIKTCSKFCSAYSSEEVIHQRQKAFRAAERGASSSEQYSAGNGYGGTITAHDIQEQKYHKIISGLHAQIAICGRMFLDLLVMISINQTRFFDTPKNKWDDAMKEVWDIQVKQVKQDIATNFSVYLGLRDAAKLSNVILDPTIKWEMDTSLNCTTNENHEKLIQIFVADGDKDMENILRVLLHQIYDIFAIARASHPSEDHIQSFREQCVVFSDSLNESFPHLSWPWYMHYVISHGQEMMEALGSIGLFNEQSSEHCNKLIKRFIKWNSRSNSPINCLVDTIRRLWWIGDPLHRDFFLNFDDANDDDM